MSEAKRQRRWASAIVGIALVGMSVTAVASNSSAQTAALPIPTRLTIPPLPPTFPCPLCGPSGQRGDGTTAWVYPLHFCPNTDGSAEFAIIYGLGSRYLGSPSVTFFGAIQGRLRQLRTLRPGDETAEYPTVNVQPGESFTLRVWATTNGQADGPRVLFGNGTRLREMLLICECPTTQTVVTTGPTTIGTTVPTTTGTTLPNTPTSVARTTPNTPTTVVQGSLPATGNALPLYVAAVGLVLFYFGLLAWSHTRRLDD